MNFKLFIITTAFFICGTYTISIVVPRSPPPHWKHALMARYIMHQSDWISLATISTQTAIKDYPFVLLKSVSDGTSDESTGIPYLYMSPLDASAKDLEANQKVTVMATMAQTDYCRVENLDPQDPRCAKLIITGQYVKVNKSSPEYEFGENVLFDRHPDMKNWPVGHNFYVAKVTPILIELLDFFGGIKEVSIKDYFDPNITNIINVDVTFNTVSVLQINSEKGHM